MESKISQNCHFGVSVLRISPTNFYFLRLQRVNQLLYQERTKVYKAEYIAWAKKKTALKNSNISPHRELANLHTPVFTQK